MSLRTKIIEILQISQPNILNQHKAYQETVASFETEAVVQRISDIAQVATWRCRKTQFLVRKQNGYVNQEEKDILMAFTFMILNHVFEKQRQFVS